MAERIRREAWVDKVKSFACILVVLGHFFQSMVRSGILSQSGLYLWFDQTIYYFHVPLFFICSGYLYQKGTRFDSAADWRRNVIKKAVNLGVPYFVFSTATWCLKFLFPGAAHEPVGGLLETLFVSPISPYWYLYSLFLCFLVIPVASGKKMAAAQLVLALGANVLMNLSTGISWRGAAYMLFNAVWFVSGMALSSFGFQNQPGKNGTVFGGLLAVAFLAASVVLFRCGVTAWPVGILMSALGCWATVLLASGNCRNRYSAWFAARTLPIFLMHTLFAASIRALLLKLRIQSPAVHIPCGLIVSFAGPIIAAEIMKNWKWAEFFLYPGKYLKLDRGKPEERIKA